MPAKPWREKWNPNTLITKTTITKTTFPLKVIKAKLIRGAIKNRTSECVIRLPVIADLSVSD